MLEGSAIYEHLHAARSCAVMAVTLGLANERYAHEGEKRARCRRVRCGGLFPGGMCGGCVRGRDRCRSGKARAAYELAFQSGYGDLPLDIQPAIVRTLEADKKLGMTVTDSNLLVPVKVSRRSSDCSTNCTKVPNEAVPDAPAPLIVHCERLVRHATDNFSCCFRRCA